MPNIFDGLKKLSEEELREYIAILETYTMTNLSKQTGQKVAKKFVQATNLFVGMMKKTPFETPEVLTLEERLRKNKLNWQMLEKDELLLHIKHVLIEKCNSIKAGELEESVSDDALYVKVINHAAELYDIKDELLICEKAELIKKSYNHEIKLLKKELEQEYKEKIREQIKDQVKEKVEKEIKEELEQKLEQKEVSELEKEEEATKEQKHLVENYDPHKLVLEENLGALPTPMGKNRLIRLLLAQLIGRSMNAYGMSFIPKDEELPSWLPVKERMELDKAYEGLTKFCVQTEEKYDQALQKLLENENEANIKKRSIEYIQTKVEEKEERIKKLIGEKEKLLEKITNLDSEEDANIEIDRDIEIQRNKKELKMKESQISTYKSMAKLNKEEIKSAKESITILEKRRESISKLVKDTLKEKELAKEALNKHKETRQNELEKKWQEIYSQFSFEKECILGITSKFTMYEIQEIERGLYELHEGKDVQAFSIGQLEEEDLEHYGLASKEEHLEHIVFSLGEGVLAMILYAVKEEESKKAHIQNIIKLRDDE
nr:hypothetical protein [uncultured Niameybacter sp.]